MKALTVIAILLCITGGVVLIRMGQIAVAIGVFAGSAIAITNLIFQLLKHEANRKAQVQAEAEREARERAEREALIPVATVDLMDQQGGHFSYDVYLQNHSNETIRARISCNSIMSGIVVSEGSPVFHRNIDIKPLENFREYAVSIERTLMVLQRNIEQMKRESYGNPEPDKLFRYSITVEYNGLKTNVKGKPIVKEYYFDFIRDQLRPTPTPE